MGRAERGITRGAWDCGAKSETVNTKSPEPSSKGGTGTPAPTCGAEQKHWDTNYGFIFTGWDYGVRDTVQELSGVSGYRCCRVNFPRKRDFKSVVKVLFIQVLCPHHFSQGKS